MRSMMAIAVSSVVLLSTAACSNMTPTEQRVMSGTVIGAAAGTAVGAMVGGLDMGAGAAIGAAVGAAGGYAYDQFLKH
jgi:osmotically inducible lipoprotein OsmB